MHRDSPSPSVGIAILTLNAEKELPLCLAPLLASTVRKKILVIDSSSHDKTVEIAQQHTLEVLSISRKAFNHGKTRELARRYLNTDIILMVTQDAYAVDAQAVERLIQPLIEGKASAAYARQIPRQNASCIGAFSRKFNYPEESHIRSLAEREKYGVYTFFFSNSFGAYCNKALDEVGGFPSVAFGEDTAVVTQLLHKGHRIAYVAEAVVEHSHEHTLLQEGRRYLDIGRTRAEYRSLMECTGTDQARGRQFVKEILHYLFSEKLFHKVPYTCLYLGVRWAAYRLGVLHFTFLSRKKIYPRRKADF